MGVRIPTHADGTQAGESLKRLTGNSLGRAASAEKRVKADDLFKGRRLIVWEIPFVAPQEGSPVDDNERRFVQMYINPQNLQVNSRKLISETRTKGGYITQYWGEELEGMNLQGTTGDAGIEGINVLRDIYRSEQIALLNIIKRTSSNVKRRQSLMQLAASVTMWYDGQGLMGYFTDMNYTENAAKPGVFDYQLNFRVTRIIGQRKNFMPWHRRPHSSAEVPFKAEQIGTGMVDGDLNVPPIADVQSGYAGMKDFVFHEGDPRDAARGYDDRYSNGELRNFGATDIIWGGVEAYITQGSSNVVASSVTDVLGLSGTPARIVENFINDRIDKLFSR